MDSGQDGYNFQAQSTFRVFAFSWFSARHAQGNPITRLNELGVVGIKQVRLFTARTTRDTQTGFFSHCETRG